MPNTHLNPLSNQQVTDNRMREIVGIGAVGYADDEAERELRLYVVFAEGRGDRVPWELCEETDVGRVMIEAANTHGSGWTISVQDAEVVPAADMERLVARLSILDSWNDFVALPEGVCTACGGTGYLSMDECINGEVVEMRGDCEGCDGSGQL